MTKVASILAGFSLLLAFTPVAQAVEQGLTMGRPIIMTPTHPVPPVVIMHPTGR